MKRSAMILAMTMVLAAVPVLAQQAQVQVSGEVEYNQINSGLFADVNSGDAVLIEFVLDATDFTDSGTYNTRGYTIDPGSFLLTLGSVSVGLQDPLPVDAVPVFVLRDNDPAVDGFFFASNGVDWPSDLPLDEPGNVGEVFGSHFEVGYTGDTLSSLDLADAYGVYDYTGLQSFYFTVNDGPFEAMGLIYSQIEISPLTTATEGASWSHVKSLY